MKVTKEVEITIVLTGKEAENLYLSIHEPYVIGSMGTIASTNDIKGEIAKQLGYTPQEAPSL